LVTAYLETRRGSLHIDDFGDFANKTPILSILFLLLMLGSIALPGTSSFVGEFLILAGAFKAHMLVGVVGSLGMVFGSIYMLTFFQKTMFGKASSTSSVGDLSFSEISALFLVVWLVFQVGIFPQGFMNKIKSSPSIQVVKEHQ
jgi:NADH-quinone oxidoreductase subunit M